MKKIFILFILSSFFIQAQTYKVVYDVKFVTDSVKKEVKYEEMDLYIAKDSTIYISPKKVNYDNYLQGLNAKNTQEFITNNTLNIAAIKEKYPSPIIDHTIIRNNGTNKILSKVNRNIYLLNQPIEEINWKIENEQKTQLDLIIKKATTTYLGRKWTAWYTEEIPNSVGPYKFGGLPGLILEIYDDNNYFHFSAIEINQNNTKPDLTKDFTKSKKVNLEDYKKIYENKGVEIIQNLKSLNITSSNISPAEMEKKIDNKLKSENVFLEKSNHINF